MATIDIRRLSTLPYGDELTLDCGDRITYKKWLELCSSFNWCEEKGPNMSPGHGPILRKIGNLHVTAPPAGNSSDDLTLHYPPSNSKLWIPVVSLPEFPHFCITADLRILQPEEYAEVGFAYTSNQLSGPNNIRFDLLRYNAAGQLVTVQEVLHIFNRATGLGSYQSWFGSLPGINPPRINYDQLEPLDSNIKLINILGTFIGGSLPQTPGGRGNCWLRVTVDYPIRASPPGGVGGAWPGAGINLAIPDTPHPLTNQEIDYDGVLSVSVNTFQDPRFSWADTIPAGALEVQPVKTPIYQSSTAANNTNNYAGWDDLRDSSDRIGWGGYTSSTGINHAHDGRYMPLIGHQGPNYFEQALQVYQIPLDIPPGMNMYELQFITRFDGDASPGVMRNMGMTIEIRKNLAVSTTTITVYNEGYNTQGSGWNYRHITGSLGSLTPLTGQVEKATLLVTLGVINPRGQVTGAPTNYWDGLLAINPRFYRE